MSFWHFVSAFIPLALVALLIVGRMWWDKRPAAKAYWAKLQDDYMAQQKRDKKT
jgi:hypothetical protein